MEKCSETGVILAIMLSNLLSWHGVLVSYGAFVCVLLDFVAFPLRLCLLCLGQLRELEGLRTEWH